MACTFSSFDLILIELMNKLTERETQVGKTKFHVTIHPPKNGQVRIEFRRWPGDLIARFTSTVHESQVEEELQRLQEWAKKDEERQEEIARRIHGDK